MSVPISKRVREAVIAQGTDPDIGLLATLNAIAARDGEIVASVYAVNYTLGNGQFFETSMAPDLLDSTTPSRYPISTIGTRSSVNKNIEKSRTFAGQVYIDWIHHLSWRLPRAQSNTEVYGDAFEEAFFFCFNDPGNQGWATPLVYNGDLSFERSPLIEGGLQFRQSFKASLIFEVYE